MPRKPKQDPAAGADSAALHGVITAMMKAQGRGGLTDMAIKLGTASPSTLRKRLANPKTSFCEITMRAVLLVAGSRADKAPNDSPLITTKKAGAYEIEIHDVNGTPTPYWKLR